MPQKEDRTVYELQQAGRTVYCNSAAYVSWLLAAGWRRCESRQLFKLVRELPAATPTPKCG